MSISVLQEGQVSTQSAGQTSVVSLTMSSGSYLDCYMTCDSGNSLSTLTAPGMSFSLVDSTTDSTNGQILYHYVSTNTTSAGSLTVTATWNSSAASFTGLWVKEIGGSSGYNNSNHASNRQAAPGTGTDGVTTGLLGTITNVPALISSLSYTTISGGSGGVLSTGTGYTTGASGWLFGSGANNAASESERVTAGTSVAATFTCSQNIVTITQAAVFTEAAAAAQQFDDDFGAYSSLFDGSEEEFGEGQIHTDHYQQTNSAQPNYSMEDGWDWNADETLAAEQEECVIVAAIDSRPIMPNGVNVVFYDDFNDEMENYDEVSWEPDLQWFGPVNPNAPPMAIGDDGTWDYSSDEAFVEEEHLTLQSIIAEAVLSTGIPQVRQSFGGGLEWHALDAEASIDEELVGVDDAPQTQAQQQQWFGDEAEQCPEDLLEEEYQGVDDPPQTQAQQQQWFGDEAEQWPEDLLEEEYQGVDDPPQTQAQVRMWFGGGAEWSVVDTEASVDEEYQGVDSPVGANAPSSLGIVYDDSAENLYEDDDEDIIDHFTNYDSAQLCYDDAWDWDLEVTFEDDHPQTLEVPVGSNASPYPVEDAWDWVQDETDEELYQPPDEYQLVNAPPVTLPIYDDAWDWDLEATLEDVYPLDTSDENRPVVANVQSTVEDPWDWSVDEVDDDWVLLDEYLNFTWPAAYDDAWDWGIDEVDDDIPSDQLVNVIQSTAFDEAWDWEELVDDDWWYVDQFINPPQLPILTYPDEWDWTQEDHESEHWDSVLDVILLSVSVRAAPTKLLVLQASTVLKAGQFSTNLKVLQATTVLQVLT